MARAEVAGSTTRSGPAVLRARFEAIFAVQSGIAAGLSWFLANENARAITLDAVRAGRVASAQGLGTSGLEVVSQVDSAATDLLCAAGLDGAEAENQVRRAAARVA